MSFTCNLSQPGLMFAFDAKKASLNSFSFKDFSKMQVFIFGRCNSKFVLLDGILSTGLNPTFIKLLLNF